MTDDLVRLGSRVGLAKETRSWTVPALVADSGPDASRRFLEFFAATIRNPNTRAAYARALNQFFGWCEDRGIRGLDQIEPMVVAAYIEQHPGSAPTVKQHLAAIRMCFDWLVTGQVLRQNPATSVKGPKHIVTRGKTPVLAADEARQLLDSIETDTIVGLRDRALIGLMVYSFARVGAAVGMSVEDYYQERKRWWFRLHEKGGKHHAVPAHHNAEQYVDAYLEAARIAGAKGTPLFRTVNRACELTERGMSRIDVFRMIKRRANAAKLPPRDLLPHVPRYRDHGIPQQRRHARESAADRRAFQPADDEALRPDQRRAHAR